MMAVSYVKECSVFPNGDIIRNDRLLELLEVVYDLLLTYDGQVILYLALYKAKFGVLSSRYPRKRKVKDFRGFMVDELGFLTKGGRIPRDVKNLLIYLDELNGLLDKLHQKLFEGKKFRFKLSLILDQYDPKSKTIFPSKNSWKAYTDEDYKRNLGDSVWNSLNELGSDE